MAGKRKRRGSSVTDPNQSAFPSTTILGDHIVVQTPHRNNRPPSSKRPKHTSSPSNNNKGLILSDYFMPNQMNLFEATSNNPSWETTRINREASNQADIASAISKAHFVSQNNRPKSTKVAYNSKQNAWKSWCMEREFDDLDTVSAGKIILWLQESIIPNGAQYKGAKRGAMLTESGLEGYIKPIIALYEVYYHPFFMLNNLLL